MDSTFETDAPALPCPAAEARDGLFRWLILGCVYAAAVAFTVAASPAVGLVALAPPQATPATPATPQYAALAPGAMR